MGRTPSPKDPLWSALPNLCRQLVEAKDINLVLSEIQTLSRYAQLFPFPPRWVSILTPRLIQSLDHPLIATLTFHVVKDSLPADAGDFAPLANLLTTQVADGRKTGIFGGILVYLVRRNKTLQSIVQKHPDVVKLQSRWEQHRVAFCSSDGFVNTDGLWAAHGLKILFPDSRHESTAHDAFLALCNASIGAIAAAAVLLLQDCEPQESLDWRGAREFLEMHRNTPDLCVEMLRFLHQSWNAFGAEILAEGGAGLFAELATHPHEAVSDAAFHLLMACLPVDGSAEPENASPPLLPFESIRMVCVHACTRPSPAGLQFVQICAVEKGNISPVDAHCAVLICTAARSAIEAEDVELATECALSLLVFAPKEGQLLLEGPMLRLLARALDQRAVALPRVLRLIAYLRPWALDQLTTDLLASKQEDVIPVPIITHSPEQEAYIRENRALRDALDRKTRCLEQASAVLSNMSLVQEERSALQSALAATEQAMREREERLSQAGEDLARAEAATKQQESLVRDLDSVRARQEHWAMEQLKKLEEDNARLFALIEEETHARVDAEKRAFMWEQRARQAEKEEFAKNAPREPDCDGDF